MLNVWILFICFAMCWYNANTHSCKFIRRCIKYFKSYKGTFPQTSCCASKIHTNESLAKEDRKQKCLSSHFDRTTHHGHFQISCRYIQQHFPCWFVQISPVGLSNWCLGRWRTHSRPSTSVVDAFLSIASDQQFFADPYVLFPVLPAPYHACYAAPVLLFFDTHTQRTHTDRHSKPS